MHKRIHAHVPYLRLAEYLPYIIQHRINPEIYFAAQALDTLSHTLLGEQAARLQDAGLATTIHAVFLDLNPGSLDRAIREATRSRFQQVLDAAVLLKPRAMVFHPGYDDLRYGDNRQAWLELSTAFWRLLLPQVHELGSVIAMENIFEKEPSTLRDLLQAVNDSRFRHCFDVGHWNMFTVGSMEEWFSELGTYMAEIHIHDNHGVSDEHLPLGEGLINFNLLFVLLRRYAPDALWTIEAHSIERLERALQNIAAYTVQPN